MGFGRATARVSLEPETFRPEASLPQIPWRRAETQKRREHELSAFCVNQRVRYFRYPEASSPTRTRT